MPSKTPTKTTQKLLQIWSSRRACQILMRIQYAVRTERGCKIYQLSPREELT